MNISTIISAMLSLASLLLGFFVVLRKPRKPTNIVFAIMCFAAALWVITNGIVDISRNYTNALFWGRMTILGPLFIPSSFLLLSRFFPDNKYVVKKYEWYIYFIPIVISLPFLFTRYNISDVNFENDIVTVTPGGLYIFLAVYLIIYFIVGSTILLKKYKKATGIKKIQIRYFFLGIIVTAAFGTIVNLLLPLLGINVLQSIGSYSTIFLVSFIAYSIVRHRLLDVKLLVTRSLVYGVLLSLVALSFVFATFISAQYFSETTASRFGISFFVATLIVYGIEPIKRILSAATDKIFFQAKIDYTKLLQSLSSVISLELNLQKLLDDLEKGLIQGLKVKSSLILLRDQDNGQTRKFRATTENGASRQEVVIDNDSQLIQFVREHQHLSLLEALERKIEDTPEGPSREKEEASRAEFERLGVALVAPIFSENHLVAVLTLGPKLSGDSFSNEDTQLIDVLAPQIGSAIQKASLYEEVRAFSEGLKVKVDEATHELRDRNVSLQTLQNITKEITRTLDFNKVVQNIANAVATELGFLGAILVFLDDDGKTLRARAVTETPLTKKAIQLLPKPFHEYTTQFDPNHAYNLGAEVIRSGEIQYSDSMAAVISPPVPKLLVATMQKLMGIRTMILVPIVSEEKVIGVIEVGAKRKREQISASEIETLKSMADELGVVARNITLFDKVRKTNDQLEVANAHLKELDRAKSEFVSIASHQLRTPMTGIMGYLSMMTQGDFGKIKPEHQKILTDLLSESQRMIRLINQFLNVSKIEAGKFTYSWKATQLEDLVTRVVKEVEKPAADKGLKLTIKMPKTKLPMIQADADKVEDVILNLLDNAIKYTAKGTVTASVGLDNGNVHFAVKDSGIGIKPKDATELFNKFVRGSGIAQIHPDGSGLGLFIAKSIIDAHGGKIWVESAGEGKGSTFQFTLPLTPPAGLEAPALNPAAHIVKPKGDVATLKNE